MLEKQDDLDLLKSARKTQSVIGELGPFGSTKKGISVVSQVTNHNAQLLEMALWEISSLKERIKVLEREYR